jgi:hypothetical protein
MPLVSSIKCAMEDAYRYLIITLRLLVELLVVVLLNLLSRLIEEDVQALELEAAGAIVSWHRGQEHRDRVSQEEVEVPPPPHEDLKRVGSASLRR